LPIFPEKILINVDIFGKVSKGEKKRVVLQFEHIKPKNVCHASESWHPDQLNWIPAFAGMTFTSKL